MTFASRLNSPSSDWNDRGTSRERNAHRGTVRRRQNLRDSIFFRLFSNLVFAENRPRWSQKCAQQDPLSLSMDSAFKKERPSSRLRCSRSQRLQNIFSHTVVSHTHTHTHTSRIQKRRLCVSREIAPTRALKDESDGVLEPCHCDLGHRWCRNI